MKTHVTSPPTTISLWSSGSQRVPRRRRLGYGTWRNSERLRRKESRSPARVGLRDAADVLLDDAEGAFDWKSDKADIRFVLRTAGEENPFAVSLASSLEPRFAAAH